jgi:hypothetical protein
MKHPASQLEEYPMRMFVSAVLALVLCVGVALADEIKGKIKSVDADKGTVTVTAADGKDHTLVMSKDTKIQAASGKDLKEGIKDKHLKAGAEVVIQCKKEGGKDVCTELKLAQPRKK